MSVKLRLVLSFPILFLFFCGWSQQSYWRQEAGQGPGYGLLRAQYKQAELRIFTLSAPDFQKALPGGNPGAGNEKVVYFPDSQGKLTPFLVRRADVLSPELAARYPQIQSYAGKGLERPEERIRFSISQKGLQGMMVHGGEQASTFMEKAEEGTERYVVYHRPEGYLADSDFLCYTASDLQIKNSGSTRKLVEDMELRKFRIAISASGEYTDFHGGTVPDALAAINATLTRVNEVFETDLGVSLELVAGTDQLIFTNPATDPYQTNYNTEAQNTFTTVLGEANYDVGHLFLKDNDNGNAGFIGSVCRDNQKGSAYSAAQNPEGDMYDLDFVAHELGHQFGANHTWSFESEGTLVQAEPASGTTIMGYAGIVDGNNVTLNGDDYFHYYSILQITQYLQGVNCGQTLDISNQPPLVASSGNFIIPKGTAFVLTGSASDPDGDLLTYTWEQIDNGVVTTSTFGPEKVGGANFRSLRPGVSPARYFPKLTEVLQGNLTQLNPGLNTAWETVSNIERELNFALTVRDNAEGGGQVSSDLVNIRVLNSAGPFAVSSQNLPETLAAGSPMTVTWEVAGTAQGLINAQQVDILLSLDGGLSYPILLADATTNDGSQEVLLPGSSSTGARVMVKADDNIFFAVNEANFAISESSIVLDFPSLDYELCQPDELVIPFVYEVFGDLEEEAVFSTSGLAAGLVATFDPPSATATGTPVEVHISGTGLIPPGNYPFTVVATASGISANVELQLNLYEAVFEEVVLSAPSNGTAALSLSPVLQWEALSSASSYELEIATDSNFNTIVETADLIFTSYLPLTLVEETTYYWRVKPKNNCGEGTFSSPFSFETIALNCKLREASDIPVLIAASGTPRILSTVAFFNDLPVAEVRVRVELEHSFLADLVVNLISPSGTTVALVSNSCGEFRDINAVFDDDAENFVCGSIPAISGTVKPLGALSSFKGESALGEWTLEILDSAPVDGGSLNAFSLELCVEGEFRPDPDEDGVFDDGDDLCPDTPLNTEVDTNGCPVYRFEAKNFRIAVQSESCVENNDGLIRITAEETLSYTVDISGNSRQISDLFTTSYELGNLSAGAYEVCLGGSKGSNVFEPYCFEIVIGEPEPLAVATAVIAGEKEVSLQLQGSEEYTIELNGVSIRQSLPQAVLPLKHGINLLRVYTDLPCQGSYEESIYIAPGSVVYPNPFGEILKVLPEGEISEISIYNASGQLLKKKVFALRGGEIELEFHGLPPGMYLVRVNGETHKVFKR